MDVLLKSLPNLKLRQLQDDDIVDQLHHYATVTILAMAALLTSVQEFVGEPLDCWWEFNTWKHYQSHVNLYCWSHRRIYAFPNQSNLNQTPYPLRPGQIGPGNENVDDLQQINVYRWVTIVIFAQAVMFKFPYLVWTLINSGTKLDKMVAIATDSTFKEGAEREKAFSTLANFFETWLKVKAGSTLIADINDKGSRTETVRRVVRRYVKTNYLSNGYLLVKTLFLTNLIAQFFILSAYLDFSFWRYGPHVPQVRDSRDPSTEFPHVGLCQFQLQGQGYWIQCNMAINLLLEKIFLVLWFWFVALLVASALNATVWFVRVWQSQASVQFVKKYLRLLGSSGNEIQIDEMVDSFVSDYLSTDGVFVLRILATNTNDVVMAQLVSCVWERYLFRNGKISGTHQAAKSGHGGDQDKAALINSLIGHGMGSGTNVKN